MRRFTLLLLACTAVVTRTDAQTCHVENGDNTYSDNVSMGSVHLAIKFTPSANFTTSRIEVFTGEVPGANSVAIWSHDSGGDKPLTSLGSGAWNSSAINGWQGAELTTPISIGNGVTYWMVWGAKGGSQASVQTGTGQGQVYRGSFDGGVTWNGPFQFGSDHWKFRLYCCTGSFQEYGIGCPGQTGNPTLTGSGCPAPTQSFNITMGNMLPGAPALLLIGSSNSIAALNPWCNIVNAPLTPIVLPFTVPLTGFLAINETVPLGSPVPSSLFLQTLVGDPAALGGIAASNGLWMLVQ